MPPPGADRALALARAALVASPAGLFTDLDGTLSPIVADPALASPLPGAADALAVLARRLAAVGVVTGRAAADARRLLGRDDLLIIGNHGLEWLEPGAADPVYSPELTAATDAIDRALAAVPAVAGVTVEHKGLSATIHYRNAAHPARAAARARATLEGAGVPGIVLRPGRMSLEVRIAGAGDKGTAVETAVRRHGLRGLVVMGDDITDLDMFHTAHHLREVAGVMAAVIGVGGGGEVPREVAEAADALLPDPAAVLELLRALG